MHQKPLKHCSWHRESSDLFSLDFPLPVSMTQPAAPADPLDASSLQDNAWNLLHALETQVHNIQASPTLHMTELTELHQTTDTISHSLQMLLEHLPPTPAATPALPTPPEMNPAPCFDISAAPHTTILCPALPNTYNETE
ncbi:hypothetical protein C0995_009073 [Termitomyces sp. Mi166|nr:hypothetical protein C0995_009073 [Termitomyces sp. Mi166\